jgi:hypothetical protein
LSTSWRCCGETVAGDLCGVQHVLAKVFDQLRRGDTLDVWRLDWLAELDPALLSKYAGI